MSNRTGVYHKDRQQVSLLEYNGDFHKRFHLSTSKSFKECFGFCIKRWNKTRMWIQPSQDCPTEESACVFGMVVRSGSGWTTRFPWSTQWHSSECVGVCLCVCILWKRIRVVPQATGFNGAITHSCGFVSVSVCETGLSHTITCWSHYSLHIN